MFSFLHSAPFRVALLSSTVLTTAVSGVAMAQDAPKDAPTTEVIVAAKRLEKTARSEQKAALNIVNIQAADTIEKYPDYNAAEALGRIPGVSLSEDTGEGRFVEIRGIDGNLNGATFGGIVLLNTQPGGTYFGGGGRAVEMDTVPIGSVDRIEVIKSGRPDMDAEGLGGTVELTPRSAATLKKPFLDFTVGVGYQPLRKDSSPRRAELTFGGRAGAFSGIFTASEFDNRQAIDDVEAAYGVDNGGATSGKDYLKVFDSLELRRYDYHRRRFGLGTELDYQPSEDHTYYLRANVAGYTEHVTRRRLVLGNLEFDANGNPLADTAGPGVTSYHASGSSFFAPSAEAQVSLRDEEETHRNTILAVGGMDHFNAVKIDYQLSYSRSTYDKPYDINSSFNNVNNDNFGLIYNNISNPNLPTYQVQNGVNLNDASQYTLHAISTSQEKDKDEETGGQFNVTLPLNWVGADELKVGARVRLREKTLTKASESWVTANQPLTAFSPTGVYSYYDNAYQIGPFENLDAIRTYTSTAAVSSSSPYATVFDDKENISALYAQYTTTVDKWGFLGGIRMEKTDGNYRFNANGAPTTFKKSYTNYFPSAQLRYQFSDDLIARATFSTGIGRPGFNQLSSGTSVDFGTSTVTGANPYLKPTTGQNYDGTVEWYLPNSGILQLGLFDKQFDNYIETGIAKGPYPGQAGSFTYVSYKNISNAWARGLEAAYNQKFTTLPGVWSGLGVEANATLVDSSAELRPGEKRALPGTSHMTGNLATFYEKYGLSLRLSTEYVGKTLFGAGGDRSTDVYQDKRQTADFYAAYAVTPAYKVYFTAKNLTNEKLRFYEGTPDRPIQREFYDASYELGLKGKF